MLDSSHSIKAFCIVLSICLELRSPIYAKAGEDLCTVAFVQLMYVCSHENGMNTRILKVAIGVQKVTAEQASFKSSHVVIRYAVLVKAGKPAHNAYQALFSKNPDVDVIYVPSMT